MEQALGAGGAVVAGVGDEEVGLSAEGEGGEVFPVGVADVAEGDRAAVAAVGAGEVDDGGAAAVVDEPEGVGGGGGGGEAAGFGDGWGSERGTGFDAGEGGWLFRGVEQGSEDEDKGEPADHGHLWTAAACCRFVATACCGVGP